MGIVFDTQESEGAKCCESLHFPLAPGIIFDTQEGCGQGVVEECFAPLVAGYRFRYPSISRGVIVDCRVSFSIPVKTEELFIKGNVMHPTCAGYRFQYPEGKEAMY